MEIVVCVKRVPKTDAKIKIAASGAAIDPAGVEYELNSYDEFALEEALRTKEALKKGTVTVVTLGSDVAQKELRDCLAKGADKAVLIKDGGVAHDGYSTAEILAAYLKTIPHDVVFTGKQAVDMDGNQVGARLATLLGMACVTEVLKLTKNEGEWLAERDIEGAREVVRCKLPAVITTQKGLNEPRYSSLKGIMASKSKPIVQVDAATVAPGIAPATKVLAMSMPPDRPPGKVWKDGAAAVPALIQALRNEVKVL
jgi:electron transfer flavoprotein beta subunit